MRSINNITFFYSFDNYLKVKNENKRTFGVFCGNKTGEVIFVTGGSVEITFHSDYKVQETGFLIVFTEVELGEYVHQRNRSCKKHTAGN